MLCPLDTVSPVLESTRTEPMGRPPSERPFLASARACLNTKFEYDFPQKVKF